MSRPRNPLWLQRLAYHRMRAQAIYRGEQWSDQFDFDTWWRIWETEWANRGTYADCTIMTRDDPEAPWHQDNVSLANRREWLQHCGRMSQGGSHRKGYRPHSAISG